MVSVTRSVGVMPYQGGTFYNTTSSMAMCRLSSSRMVWAYFQTNPNWLVTATVDTPGGLTAGATPVLVNQQLMQQRTTNTNQSLYMARLNSNTVVLIHMINIYSFTYFVYEVDSTSGVLTQVDTGTYTGVVIGNSALQTLWQGNTRLVEHKDNLVQLLYPSTFNGNLSLIQGAKMVYDPVAKKLTATLNAINLNGATTTFELTHKKIPGRDLTLVSYRYFYNSTLGYTINNGSMNFILDANGAVYMTPSQLPSFYSSTANTTASELVPLPGDRVAWVTGSNSMTFFSVDYTAKTYLPIGNGQFCSAFTDTARAVVPLTADYVALVTRAGVQIPSASTPIYVKVVRRFDQNFIEQSAASANNANLGFTVTGVPTTNTAVDSRVELVEGKLFWWGTDITGSKLSWTLVGLDQPAS